MPNFELLIASLANGTKDALEEFRKDNNLSHKDMAELMKELGNMYTRKAMTEEG